MTRARLLAIGALGGFVVVCAWLLFVALPRWYGPDPIPAAPVVAAAPGPVEPRRIKATLYYVAEDGGRLVGIERDVPYAGSTAEQARRIVEEQLKAAPEPLRSALPSGTALRALFLTGGDAYVDLGTEIASGHPGGSREEILTVYTLVNVITTNLPAIARVQILVGGREVDTLAGHVDLRRPLQKNLKWTNSSAAP
ncbi:MAG: GerMN domain-containing protein [Vicinamibacterales bacterium]